MSSNLRVARIDSLFENHTRDYSLHPDGKRFALLREVGEGLKLVVVTNWLSEAKAQAREVLTRQATPGRLVRLAIRAAYRPTKSPNGCDSASEPEPDRTVRHRA